MVQALGLSFTVSTVTLAAALGYAGEIHVTLFGPALVALAAALIGMWLGQLVRGRIAPRLSGCVSSSACCYSARIWRCVG